MSDIAQNLTTPFLAMDCDLEREFEIRISESSTLAFRVAYSVLRNREDAEDIAQEAFAKAYRNFSSLRDRARFRGWLVRITWRLAIDKQRAAKRRFLREQLHVETSTVGPVTDGVISRETARRVWQAIDDLPEKLRAVTILAGIEEYNTREVADLLGLPEGTVKSRLHEARERLRRSLQ